MDSVSQVVLAFMQSNQFAEAELRDVEKRLGLNIVDRSSGVRESLSKFYSYFDESIVSEAKFMGLRYEIFYCLEKYVRQTVVDILEEIDENWWDNLVPEAVRMSVSTRVQQEQDAGLTPRSIDNIDFTTFGELSGIIEKNWDVFAGIFLNKQALKKNMHIFSALRNYVAHCAPMPEHEFARFKIHLDDFFRLLGVGGPGEFLGKKCSAS